MYNSVIVYIIFHINGLFLSSLFLYELVDNCILGQVFTVDFITGYMKLALYVTVKQGMDYYILDTYKPNLRIIN